MRLYISRHQIYFDKIHCSLPMIHKFRYLAAMNLYAMPLETKEVYHSDSLTVHRISVHQLHYDTLSGRSQLRQLISILISQIISTGDRGNI